MGWPRLQRHRWLRQLDDTASIMGGLEGLGQINGPGTVAAHRAQGETADALPK